MLMGLLGFVKDRKKPKIMGYYCTQCKNWFEAQVHYCLSSLIQAQLWYVIYSVFLLYNISIIKLLLHQVGSKFKSGVSKLPLSNPPPKKIKENTPHRQPPHFSFRYGAAASEEFTLKGKTPDLFVSPCTPLGNLFHLDHNLSNMKKNKDIFDNESYVSNIQNNCSPWDLNLWLKTMKVFGHPWAKSAKSIFLLPDEQDHCFKQSLPLQESRNPSH